MNSDKLSKLRAFAQSLRDYGGGRGMTGHRMTERHMNEYADKLTAILDSPEPESSLERRNGAIADLPYDDDPEPEPEAEPVACPKKIQSSETAEQCNSVESLIDNVYLILPKDRPTHIAKLHEAVTERVDRLAHELADSIETGWKMFAELESLKNRLELLQEDLEVIHLCLDKEQIPRKDGSLNLSVWGRVCRFKEKELESLRAWKEAVIDALVIGHMFKAEHENSPRQAIADLIAWETQIALDPRVSSDAQKLVDDATESLRAELAKAREDAERYRWLRCDSDEFRSSLRSIGCTRLINISDDDWLYGEELDAAIDAARKGEMK